MKTYALSQPVDGSDTWHDGKRYAWLLGLVVPILPFLAIGLHLLTGLSAVLWLGPVVILVIVPLIDLVAGLDSTNPPDEVTDALEEDRYYRWVTYAYLPLQYAGLFAGIGYIALAGAPLIGDIGLAVTLGTVAGIAINTAHELGHKREDVERWAAKVALAPSFYGHFYVEHNRGHHVRVSTPEDPASARMGESFYRFWPRTVFGALVSAWRLERKRYARRDRHPYRIGNDVLNAWLMSGVLWGALIASFGWGVLPYLLLQAVVGATLLELVNYMEHYGMLRQKIGPPDRRRYERVTPAHSWNSNNIATNVLLYHLQRHSDHHANPTRRFQTLRDFPEAPVLPTGYAGMMVAALVPPVFRALMDPRVVAHYDGDLRRANLHPAAREKLLAAYPPPASDVDPDERSATESTPRTESSDSGTSLCTEGSDSGTSLCTESSDSGTSLCTESSDSATSLCTESSDSATSLCTKGSDSGTSLCTAARCPGCGYTYEVAAGNEAEGFPAGTAWSDIPDDWTCPDCGVRDKVDFVALDGDTECHAGAAGRASA